MKAADRYHKWVEWSEENHAYLGKCPDLITGIHGNDPREVYADLCEVVADVIENLQSRGRPLPEPRIRPMREVV
jgi:hypothetical protein